MELPTFKIRDLVANYIGGGWGNDEANSEFSEPGFVIRGTDIPPLKTGTVNLDVYRYHKPSNLRSRTLVEGDIVFEVSGGSTGQPLGRNALITESILAKFGAPVMCASFCKMIRPNRDVVEPAFLQRVFDYLLHVEKIQQFEVQSTGISNYQFEDFLDYQKIPLPPLPLQRQIAAVLGRYDALLENYQAQVAALEGLAQELYREWFVRGRCPGAQAGPNGELPAGWEAVELSSISALIQRGITPSYDDEGEILCLNQRCIREKKIDYSTGRLQVKNPGKKVVQFGDVLINSTGEGTLGRTAQVYNSIEEVVTVDTHITIARPLPEIPVDYYGYVVTEQEDYFVSMALGATGQTELSREAIGQAKVVLPSTEAMQRFSQLVSPMKKKIIVLLAQMVTLRATRDALLPRLLSGQLLPATIPIPA